MRVVIQCAASKRADAGCLRTKAGQKVLFVADPTRAPPSETYVYARPDDVADDDGTTWRQTLLHYHETNDNVLGLLPAYKLYYHTVYRRLVERFGIERTFVLSAGWGLIRADFLTPVYDITFSAAVRPRAPHKLRRRTDVYADFQQLPESSEEPVVFFGGKDYRPLFCSLTPRVKGQRIVFFNSASVPTGAGCVFRRFDTTTRTNWQYICAESLLDGRITI